MAQWQGAWLRIKRFQVRPLAWSIYFALSKISIFCPWSLLVERSHFSKFWFQLLERVNDTSTLSRSRSVDLWCDTSPQHLIQPVPWYGRAHGSDTELGAIDRAIEAQKRFCIRKPRRTFSPDSFMISIESRTLFDAKASIDLFPHPEVRIPSPMISTCSTELWQIFWHRRDVAKMPGLPQTHVFDRLFFC